MKEAKTTSKKRKEHTRKEINWMGTNREMKKEIKTDIQEERTKYRKK